MEQNSFLRKNDLILVAVFIGITMIGFLFLHFHQSGGSYLQIRLDQEVYGNYSLEEDQTIHLTGDDFSNQVMIQDGKATMIQADCPDQICVHHKAINKDGETIICLPHKIVLEVINEDGMDQPDYDVMAK